MFIISILVHLLVISVQQYMDRKWEDISFFYRWVNCKNAISASLIARFMGPTWAHLGRSGPRWALCWLYEPCYLGCKAKILQIRKTYLIQRNVQLYVHLENKYAVNTSLRFNFMYLLYDIITIMQCLVSPQGIWRNQYNSYDNKFFTRISSCRQSTLMTGDGIPVQVHINKWNIIMVRDTDISWSLICHTTGNLHQSQAAL